MNGSEFVGEIGWRENMRKGEGEKVVGWFMEGVKSGVGGGGCVEVVGLGGLEVKEEEGGEGGKGVKGERIEMGGKKVVKLKVGEGVKKGGKGK